MQVEIRTLEAQPFFKGMSPGLIKMLAEDAMTVEFRAGELIFNEGGLANRFYLLLSGKVELESPTDSEHEPVVIETIGEGNALGWSWLFPPYYWHFDARAVTPIKAIFFYGTRLREKCETDNELGYELMKRVSGIVVKRLQATRRRLAERNSELMTPV